MNQTIASSVALSGTSQPYGGKSFSPSTNPDRIERKHTRKVTLSIALEAIQRRFSQLAEIISIEDENIIDIIIKDLYSNKYFEIFSNTAHTSLKIKQIL